MYGFSVDLGRLTGLESDLADLADNLRSSTAQITDALALPAQTAGLLSAIDGPLRRFSEQVSEARGQDQNSLRSFGSDLAAASQDYVQQENRNTDAFATIGGQTATGTTNPAEVRFPALDLPSPMFSHHR
jgi:ABC-type Fe2+-enterobactin transport system substrate-binding protein